MGDVLAGEEDYKRSERADSPATSSSHVNSRIAPPIGGSSVNRESGSETRTTDR